MALHLLLARDVLKIPHELDALEQAQVVTDLHAARDVEAEAVTALEAALAVQRQAVDAARTARRSLEVQRATGQRIDVYEISKSWDSGSDEIVIVDLADGSELERRALTEGETLTLADLGVRPLDFVLGGLPL